MFLRQRRLDLTDMGAGNEIEWLGRDEQRAWRAYILGTELLQHQLDHELREEHDISFSEYEILVRLSETVDGRMRMATLADSMCHSRSRVTHTVARMERAGLVQRQAARSDGRGVEEVVVLAKVAPPPPFEKGKRQTAAISGAVSCARPPAPLKPIGMACVDRLTIPAYPANIGAAA